MEGEENISDSRSQIKQCESKSLIPEMPRLHEDSRQQLRLFAELQGYRFCTHESVYPSPSYSQYPTVFMSAMQPDLAWLYQGEIPENVQTIVSTSFCIRSNNNFHNAGRSNQNLKCFEMLSISGRMSERELLENVHRILKNQLDGSGATLSMLLHPDDSIAKTFCRENDLEYDEDIDSVFEQPDKTDRVGMKVEWFATKKIGGNTRRVELMDALVLSSRNHGTDLLTPPLVEAGGSFERLLALREGVEHVLLSSAFDVAGLQYTAKAANADITLEHAFTLQDLIRPIAVMAGSDFHLPISQKKGTKQEKVFYSACHELALSVLEQSLTSAVLAQLIERDVRYLKSWKDPGYNFSKFDAMMTIQSVLTVVETVQGSYENTLRYLKQNRGKWNNEELIRKAADRYFGGTIRLAVLAMNTLEQS